MLDEVVVEVADVARVRLNRPGAINALSYEMCQYLLECFEELASNEAVTSVELTGAGSRGFCAGMDVRQLREKGLVSPDLAKQFFAAEYALNAFLAQFPKPIVSHMVGITMGGGLGLTVHSAGRRIADQTTKIAMPETTIGLWPDVGVTYELSRAPGEVGTYLAMSGAAIDGASALFAGLVDEAAGDARTSALAAAKPWIDECFAGNNAAEIMDRLLAHDNDEANAAGRLIQSRSPLSVCVALEAVRRAARLTTVAEVLAQDLVLAGNFADDSDYLEGVRAQLVDKDRNPRWRHKSVADVPASLIADMFS